MKGLLRGKSIQANLLPQHLEDIWDKRVDKQVKCYSICSRTNIEKYVLLEDTRALNDLAVNTFVGRIIATKIERYLSKAGTITIFVTTHIINTSCHNNILYYIMVYYTIYWCVIPYIGILYHIPIYYIM